MDPGSAPHCLPPRSLADPDARAAALRPLSSERARALGVALAEEGDDADTAAGERDCGSGPAEAAAEAAAALTSPPRRALRSLFQE